MIGEPLLDLLVRRVEVIDGAGRCLAPGFVDAHAHDGAQVIEAPQMLPKLPQGVTTVVVGNCGISAEPVRPEQWGQAAQALAPLDATAARQVCHGDCYPYTAGSSTLDLGQVDDDTESPSPGRTPARSRRRLRSAASPKRGACRGWRPRAACSRPARCTTTGARTTCG